MRAPIRRKRRAIRHVRRRLRKVRRRQRTGNITVSMKSLYVAPVEGKTGYLLQISPAVSDFTEAATFINYFEAYRIWSVKVKVNPLFNVAADTTPVPRYYSAPWHKPGPTSINSTGIVTIDKCKSYNGLSGSVRRFVPAVLTATGYAGITTPQYGKINWRPRIELNSNTATLPHYCGLYLWSADQQEGSTHIRQYEIETEIKVTFYNQKSFLG
ncbi:Cap protein [Cyclovirus PKbeef23/PAK/2009]|uniref:Cap protein n=1 Tax=Bovine cyclovirus TaxID=1455632 RepID=E9NWS3_9CIRC|nr:Cap protein [Cyclovirus PKgoat21/PAK/2009]YP_009506304.1 Cap protein [Cyclovirus PKbeef23/PAK/2009]ADU76994.1 Cap protein [Cyclovirus PKbeef23/PAK/2009]ADU76996.1 Cap protein [Cyclovirus PKgoat21/PAK/2009]